MLFSNRLFPQFQQIYHHIFFKYIHHNKITITNSKGKVLVVGGGNSGMQIAVELAKTHEVTVSISHPLTFLPLQLLEKYF